MSDVSLIFLYYFVCQLQKFAYICAFMEFFEKTIVMRTVRILVAVLCLGFASAMSATTAMAQESGNRDANGKVVRGPYLTSKFSENWFIGIAGGVNVFGDGGYPGALGGELDATVGKWITPSIAARVGYSGLTGSMWSSKATVLGSELVEGKDMYKQRFGFSYLHADALWNISNAIGGYKERVWDFVPYVHAGIMMTYNRPGAELFRDREFGVGLGLLNNVRLHKRLNLTLDLRSVFVSGKHHTAANGLSAALQAAVGVSVNLGKTGWTRASEWHNPVDADKISAAEAKAAALSTENEALTADKEKLAKANKELADANAELAKKAAETKSALDEIGPASVYFEIGQTTLSAKELQHLDFYLKNVLPNVSNDKVAVLTGCADSATGSLKRNKYLSQKRVDYVKNLLAEKYGIEADRFQIRTKIAEEGEAAFNRAVVISFE